MSQFGLKKNERLKSKKDISSLFTEQQFVFQYPIKLFYRITDCESSHKILFSVSVSKKNIRQANKRNLIKRRIRENYRLNKNGFKFLDAENKQLQLMFLYIAKDVVDYNTINKTIIKHAKLLKKKIDIVE